MLKYTKFTLIIALALSSVPVSASFVTPFQEVLDDAKARFLQATTKQEKFNIVTQPMNADYISGFDGDIKDMDKTELAKSVSRDVTEYPVDSGYDYNTKKTNPLALAILLGKADILEDFLTVVDNVNSHQVGVWGWRQPYSLAHVALGPKHPFNHKDVGLEDRLKIIDILAQHAADFNFKFPFKAGEYCNPPLHAPESADGRYQFVSQLQARALLYGADPNLKGTSFGGISEHKVEYLLTEYAYPYLPKIDAKLLKPTKAVGAVLKRILQDMAARF